MSGASSARLTIVAAAAVLLAGCSSAVPGAPDPTTANPTTANPTTAFPAGVGVDYQLGGAYPPPDGVGIVTRDSTAQPAPGVYSICYVNGFQTQPDDSARWVDSPLVLRDDGGDPVTDPDWPGEYILDIGSSAGRESILDEMGPVIDRCRDSGFDAVEVDNLDTYTRFAGRLDRGSALAMAELYVTRAHGLGLEVGQKNSPDDAADFAAEAGFDFAVAEECLFYDECASYTEVYGDRVIDVEYTDALRGTVADVCDDPDRIASTVVRDRQLVAAGSDGYVHERC